MGMDDEREVETGNRLVRTAAVLAPSPALVLVLLLPLVTVILSIAAAAGA